MSRLLAIVIALAGALAGTTIALAANAPVQIVNCPGFPGCYSPNPIQVSSASTVTWTNAAGTSHTATSDTGAWDTGVIAPGQTSAAVTFNTPGTYAYHCAIHPSMQGTVVVTAAVSTTPTPVASRPPTPRLLAQGGAAPMRLPVAGAGAATGIVALAIGLALLASGGRRRQRSQAARS